MGMDGLGVIPKQAALGLKSIAAAMVITGKLERHHLFVEALLKDKKVAGALEELGVNIQSKGNRVWALQNGGAAGHRAYSEKNLKTVQGIIRDYLAGRLDKKQALEALAKHRRELRNGLKDDPSQLARKKSDMVLKQQNSATTGSGSDGNPAGGAGSCIVNLVGGGGC